MWRKLLQHWREILGWLTIAIFSYIYLYEINNIAVLARRTMAFEFLVVVTILILGWLRLNKK